MGSKCSPNKQVLSAKTNSLAVEPQTSGKRQAQRCGETCRAAPRGLQDCRQKHAEDPGGQCSAADGHTAKAVVCQSRIATRVPTKEVDPESADNEGWHQPGAEKKKTTPNLSRSFPAPTSLKTPPLYKRLGTRGNRPIRIPTAT